MEKTLEQIEEDIMHKKNQLALIQQDKDTVDLLQTKKKELLQGEEANNLGTLIATEDIKSNFASEASRINQRNVETAERELDTKTRQRRLDRLNAELDEQHKYNMAMIKQNGLHKQMLDKRKKLVEKYGYLYDNKETVLAVDSEGEEYQVPKDFSYSVIVNRFRQFGRNISKLDRPLLQTIKWALIIGVVVGGIFLLKRFGILN